MSSEPLTYDERAELEQLRAERDAAQQPANNAPGGPTEPAAASTPDTGPELEQEAPRAAAAPDEAPGEDQDQPDRGESGVDRPHELGGRPMGAALGYAYGDTAVLEQRIAALEAQQSGQTEALRLILEGRWTGAMPHAAAVVDALMGGERQDFHPVDFPKDDGQ